MRSIALDNSYEHRSNSM